MKLQSRTGFILGCATLLVGSGCLPTSQPPTGDVTVNLVSVTSGLTAPTELVIPDDGSGRMFVAEQTGRVRTLAADGTIAGTLLDLRDKLVTLNAGYDERGLLGLALHPAFASNGRLFVYYVAEGGDDFAFADGGESRISEFQLSSGAETIDPDSERIVLRFGQPQATHNAGKIAFGSDGYLYIASGDGGNRGDTGPGHGPEGNAQDLGSLLGKILRIDVDGEQPYEIPDDNPFVDVSGARGEIFALGLRNPWKFSFDPTSDNPRLLVGDVGQSLREEISMVEKGGNYGWRVREGDVCFDVSSLLVPPSSCAASDARGADLQEPVLAYPRANGTSVVGGLVSMSSGVSELDGKYLFGDFSSTTGGSDGRLYVADIFGSDPSAFEEIVIANRPGDRLGLYLYGFAESPDGTVYVLASGIPAPTGTSGEIFRLTAAASE